MAAKKKTTIKAPGKDPISFKPGGLHESLGVPKDKPIPAKAMQDAVSGKKGPKAQKQAVMAKGLLASGRKTAAKNRGTSK
jgi:hypothetical protein